MTDPLGEAIFGAANYALTTLVDWTAAVPKDAWVLVGGGVIAFAARDTLFETHAVASYNVCRAISEARADREWNRLGSLSEPEFDELIAARNDWAREEFRNADICKNAGDAVGPWFGFPGRRQSLRRRARKHTDKMHAINRETQRLLELKALVDSERAKQSVKVNASGVRRLMANLAADSDAVASSALLELNRIAGGIDWEPFLPDGMAPAVRTRTLSILRRLAGTNNLGEARNAHAQYRQALKAHGVTA